MSKFHFACYAIVTALVFMPVITVARETPVTNDLGGYLCKDLMRLSGEDRQIALALIHGYRLGKSGTTRFESDSLSQMTDRFIDYCLDHPAENALQSFEKFAK